MKRQVALLRGINVGKNKRISMADLRALLTGLGYQDVATLLQSGNAVYSSKDAPELAARKIEKAIAASAGFESSVVVRNGEELAAVVRHNPFAKIADDASRYLVVFLSAEPSAAVMKELAGIDVAPDQYRLKGRELYLWCPDNVRESKAVKLFTDKRLKVVATARNWNTVEKLKAMLEE